MKKHLVVASMLFAATVTVMSCGNNESDVKVESDTTVNVPVPPPDNSNATNPSLADTGYATRDTIPGRRDSIR